MCLGGTFILVSTKWGDIYLGLEICQEIHDYGAMSELVELMDSDNPGVRSAAVIVARNIYQLSVDYRREFIELEGLDKLIRTLKG